MNLKKFFICFLFFPTLLFAKIFESADLADILPYANKDTLIAFDIDNTLIDSEQQLGSSQSGYYFYEKFLQLGLSKEEASRLEIQRWMMIQPLIRVRMIASNTIDIMEKLKEKGAKIIAITSRHPGESSFTHKQLSSVSIQIENLIACDNYIQLPLEQIATYFNGILFCGSWNTKGAVLTAFLKQTSITPKMIVLIDDKLKHVEEVEKSLEEMKVEFIGMRFSGSDHLIQQLDPKILDLQWSLFPMIISDEEAKSLLKHDLIEAQTSLKMAFRLVQIS